MITIYMQGSCCRNWHGHHDFWEREYWMVYILERKIEVCLWFNQSPQHGGHRHQEIDIDIDQEKCLETAILLASLLYLICKLFKALKAEM